MKKRIAPLVIISVTTSIFTAAPAKAISYVFSGLNNYSCGTGDAFSCNITYNDFKADFNGTSWSQITTGTGTIVVTSTEGGFYEFNQIGTSVVGTATEIQFSRLGNSFSMNLAPAASNTPGFITSPTSLISTGFSSSNFNTSSSTLTGTGFAQAVPFIPSILALLPLSSIARKRKSRSLLTSV